MTQGRSGSSQNLDKLVLLGLVRLAIALGQARPEHEYMVKLARLKKLGRRQRTDMAEKAEKILAEATRVGSWLEKPIYAAATLGLRKAEFCGLKPTDISGGTLTLRRQRSHRLGERDGLKSGHKQRIIGLPADIATRLAGYHRPGTAYLFTLPDGRPIPYQHLDRELGRILAGLPDIGHVTIHDFRSAAISRLIAAGASDSQIIEIVGHSSAAHLKHYRDESAARTRDTLSTLGTNG